MTLMGKLGWLMWAVGLVAGLGAGILIGYAAWGPV